MQQLMGVEMALIVISIFNMVGSAIISLVFSWKLGLIGLFVIMPIVVCAGLVRIRLEIKFQLMNEDVFAESSQFATEAIGAFRTVTSLTMESLIINRYAVLLKNQATTALKKAITATIVFAASDSLDILCTAFVFWYVDARCLLKETCMV
jgi:ATP-binding cassette, subfamily B (MDR/TAP), member 1